VLQAAVGTISFERILARATDIVVDAHDDGSGVKIVSIAELPLHSNGVEQCVLGIRVALGNVPRLCQTSEGVYTEFGVRSVLVLQSDTAVGELPASLRSIRDTSRSLARIKDQRSSPQTVHEGLIQIKVGVPSAVRVCNGLHLVT